MTLAGTAGGGATTFGRGRATGFAAGEVAVVGAGSSTGSPIVTVDGPGSVAMVAGGATVGAGDRLRTAAPGVALEPADAGCFGSSVDTAMTAATVRRTTTAAVTIIPARAPTLVFFGGGATAAMLRIGPRPALMSCAV